MGLDRYRWTTFVRETVFILLGAVFVVPVGYILMVSLKSPEEAAIDPFGLPTSLTLASYAQAWDTAGSSGLGTALLMSAFITLFSLLLVLLVSIPCAYALVRRPGKPTMVLMAVFLLCIIVPYQLGILPLFVAMNKAGLVGTLIGVCLVYLGQFTPFTVFILTGFVRKLPVEYEEAARMDGASSLRVLLNIVVPLLRPGIATVGILAGLLIWNDFFVPLIWLSGSPQAPVPVAIFSFVGQFTSQWSIVFAGILISVLPVLIVYMFTQKYLIRGFTSGIRG